MSTGGRDKSSILSDRRRGAASARSTSTRGFEVAGEVVHRLFDPLMAAAAELGAGLDWKTSLQELAADLGLGVPEYLIDDSGPDHEKTFVARVRVGEASTVTARPVKKEAEQQAAETAWRASAPRIRPQPSPTARGPEAAGARAVSQRLRRPRTRRRDAFRASRSRRGARAARGRGRPPRPRRRTSSATPSNASSVLHPRPVRRHLAGPTTSRGGSPTSR